MSDAKKAGFWQRVFGRTPGATPAPGCCCCASAMEQAIEDAKRLAAEEKDGAKPDSRT